MLFIINKLRVILMSFCDTFAHRRDLRNAFPPSRVRLPGPDFSMRPGVEIMRKVGWFGWWGVSIWEFVVRLGIGRGRLLWFPTLPNNGEGWGTQIGGKSN
jgi:hypothetical protein